MLANNLHDVENAHTHRVRGVQRDESGTMKDAHKSEGMLRKMKESSP
jgi:hypothetical protein